VSTTPATAIDSGGASGHGGDGTTPPGGRGPRRGQGWGSLGAVVAGTIAVIALVVVLLVEVVGLGTGSDDPSNRLPAGFVDAGSHNYGRAPSYTLVDQNGRRFSSAQLDGKVQVVSYLFPYCTSYCPLTARVMKQAEDQLRAAGLMDKVAFVAFNVDPENTGPVQERSFLREYGISPADPAWHFLSGRPATVRHVVHDGFHIYYQKVSLASERREERREKRAGTYHAQPETANPLASRAGVNYDVVHNDSIEIVGRTGRIVYYTSFGNKVTADQLAAAVRAAVQR